MANLHRVHRRNPLILAQIDYVAADIVQMMRQKVVLEGLSTDQLYVISDTILDELATRDDRRSRHPDEGTTDV